MGCATSQHQHQHTYDKAVHTGVLKCIDAQLTRLPAQWQLQHLSEIWLQNNRLTNEALFQRHHVGGTNTEVIYLSNNRITSLPPSLASTWTRLQELNLSGNAQFDGCVPHQAAAAWSDLRQLYLNDLPLLSDTPFPASSSAWTQLRVLHFNRTNGTTKGVTSLPPHGVVAWTHLTQFCCNGNALTSLPLEIGAWVNVVKIFANDNHIAALPTSIGQLVSLEKLYLSGNALTTVPLEIGRLTHLDELYLNHNNLAALPETVHELMSLTKLYVDDNGLTHLPKALPSSLQILHANRNAFVDIPMDSIVAGGGGGGGGGGQNAKLMFIHLGGNRVAYSVAKCLQFLEHVGTGGFPELRVLELMGNDCFENSVSCRAQLNIAKASLIQAWSFDTGTKSPLV